MDRDLPQIPGGLGPSSFSDQTGIRLVQCINKSGVTLTHGALVVLDTTAANVVKGKPIPVTTTTSATSTKCLGAVDDKASDTPDGALVLVQVAGLHPGVQVDGTTDLSAGDMIGPFTTAQQAAKVTDVDYRVGYYEDDDYTTNATMARKKVFLTNPLGIN